MTASDFDGLRRLVAERVRQAQLVQERSVAMAEWRKTVTGTGRSARGTVSVTVDGDGFITEARCRVSVFGNTDEATRAIGEALDAARADLSAKAADQAQGLVVLDDDTAIEQADAFLDKLFDSVEM